MILKNIDIGYVFIPSVLEYENSSGLRNSSNFIPNQPFIYFFSSYKLD